MSSVNWAVVGLGVLIALSAMAMPAETTETVYEDGYYIDKTEDNEYKTPALVFGAGTMLIGFFVGSDSQPTERTDRPPDS